MSMASPYSYAYLFEAAGISRQIQFSLKLIY